MKFQSQIEAGAKLLDEKVPGWESEIDLEVLDLGNPCLCVIGQSFPDKSYVDALMDLLEDEDNDNYLFEESDNCGFATYGSYAALTEEWKQFIQERKMQKSGR